MNPQPVLTINAQCDKDDQDPTSRCGPCKERDRACSQRTLSNNRMASIRINIQNNRCQEIVKWMMIQIPKDRELLLKQLPEDGAERLSVEFNMHLLSHCNKGDLQRFSRISSLFADVRVLTSNLVLIILRNLKECRL